MCSKETKRYAVAHDGAAALGTTTGSCFCTHSCAAILGYARDVMLRNTFYVACFTRRSSSSRTDSFPSPLARPETRETTKGCHTQNTYAFIDAPLPSLQALHRRRVLPVLLARHYLPHARARRRRDMNAILPTLASGGYQRASPLLRVRCPVKTPAAQHTEQASPQRHCTRERTPSTDTDDRTTSTKRLRPCFSDDLAVLTAVVAFVMPACRVGQGPA